ncbi:hypothetical protein HYH02_011547 [Chlamydomonas schloesseri]|uniref:Uncharacterized protein n=1 Tax=Chlamydomonas schloesseri TaxID=2026947 RepID=A0A835T0D5_9CHLO|nr:hypothetical protein HYH02_011547 [Chlamydomonas schloesseri]|eukprot:KAG2436612.1 hypothetical protein HYH02_011547 [Chlamydomonas schloesseri]
MPPKTFWREDVSKLLKEQQENLAVLKGNQLPVAIAVVKAWNLNPRTIPRKHGPKIQYDYFCINDLRNIPATHQPLIADATAGVRHAKAAAPPSPSGGAATAAAAAAGPAGTATGPQAEAAQTAPETEMTLAEHETANLADSVAEQQAALRRSAGLGAFAVAASAAPRQSLSVVQAPAKGPAGLGLSGSSGVGLGGGGGGAQQQQQQQQSAEPESALTQYMVVEVTPRGQVRALHRSDAVYDVGPVYSQAKVAFEEGGLHGFACLDEAVAGEPPQLLEHSRLPLAVAELRAWNGHTPAGHGGSAGGQPAAAVPPPPPPPGQRWGLQFARVVRLHEVPPELCMDIPAVMLWRERH